MKIRKATAADLPAMTAIYEYARRFMAEHGNPAQWGSGYPFPDMLEDDIAEGKSYVCEDGGKIACVFYYDIGDEPTYHEIDGAWLNDREYGVVHRIAAAGGTRGAATFCLEWAFRDCGNLRIDTHDDNTPMRRLLDKLGFTYCGGIICEDGTPRRAYQKCGE